MGIYCPYICPKGYPFSFPAPLGAVCATRIFLVTPKGAQRALSPFGGCSEDCPFGATTKALWAYIEGSLPFVGAPLGQSSFSCPPGQSLLRSPSGLLAKPISPVLSDKYALYITPEGVVGRAYCTFRCWKRALWAYIARRGSRCPFGHISV